MDKYEAMLKLLTEAIQVNKASLAATDTKATSNDIPVGVSNRHLHLSQMDLNRLFGEGYQLTKLKDLSQPGQYACKETLTLCGPNGAIEKVRILGPVRSETQVEVMTGDGFKLGLSAQTRLSGDLKGTSAIAIVGPKGSVHIAEGMIVAQRHIHMRPEDARHFGVQDGQIISIQFNGPRGGIYNNVAVRVSDASALECHIDTEEANAMNINSLSQIKIIK